MQFSGLHFHMVLVVALICVIVYVFYISKDILTLDSEVRSVKGQVEFLQQQLQLQKSVHVVSDKVVVERPVVVEQEQEQEEDDETTPSVSTDHLHKLVETLDEVEVAEEDGVDATAEAETRTIRPTASHLTVAELKTLCKKHGLPTKGTKEQLMESLNTLVG